MHRHAQVPQDSACGYTDPQTLGVQTTLQVEVGVVPLLGFLSISCCYLYTIGHLILQFKDAILCVFEKLRCTMSATHTHTYTRCIPWTLEESHPMDDALVEEFTLNQ